MKNISSEKRFLMLISSVHPETELIYQCHTDLCVKVNKTRIGDFWKHTSAAVYKNDDKSLYVFEADRTHDHNDGKDIQAAIKWYLSYYNLGVRPNYRKSIEY